MLNMFLDTMMADPPPQCLVWLPLMHRLAHVENGEHGLTLCPLGHREEEAVCGILSYYCEKLTLTFADTSSIKLVTCFREYLFHNKNRSLVTYIGF